MGIPELAELLVVPQLPEYRSAIFANFSLNLLRPD